MTSSKNFKKILLYPEKMDIDENGVKNFFWPIKLNYARNFQLDLLKELELFSKKEKKDVKDIIFLNLPFILRNITILFTAKKFVNKYLELKYLKEKTENNLIDEIIFNKSISLPKEVKIILKGLKKRMAIISILKEIKNIFFTSNLSYINKKKISKHHTVTFSNNFLIKKQSAFLPSNKQVRMSNFRDWFPCKPINLKKKKILTKKSLDSLNKIILKQMRKYNLFLNANEKNYIFDLLFNLFFITEFLLNELKKNKDFLPQKLWIGTAGNFYNRIFAFVVKQFGGRVSGFDHGMSTACINTISQNIIDFSIVDYFYTYTSFTKKELKKSFKKNFFNKTFKKENILNVKRNNLNFYQKIKNKNKKIKKVLYVPRIYLGDRFLFSLDNFYSDIIYVDWQVRLINLLSSLNYNIYIKPHPGSHSKFPNNLKNLFNIKFCNNSIEEEIKSADLLIFDAFQSSAFLSAIKSNIPIVCLNIKELDIKKKAISLIKKRCGYVSCYLDKNNRIKINKKNISKALNESLNLNQNKSFYNCYFN